MNEPSAGPRPLRVGIGLIERGGRFLVRRRPEGAVYAGYWEFPGGKCEPGETPEDATVRECREETGLSVVLGPLRRRTAHTYPHGRVELYYYDGRPRDAGDEPAEGSGFRWVEASTLPALRFPEANAPVLDDLAREFSEGRG